MIKEETIKQLLLEMVQIKSDTGTDEECEIEDYIYNYFLEQPYFAENRYCGKYHLAHDPCHRSVVWAMVKGDSTETIILLNHHDVVDAEDYDRLKNIAYSPDALKDALKTLACDESIEKDLQDENWLFGRGTADMKGGAAIQMTLMSEYSYRKDFNGTLLFLSVPDEESLSSGMRAGVTLLTSLKKEYGLQYKLLINSEPHTREDGNYTIYDGSVGKTMATVYVAGQKSHIGNVFDGLNPSLILSNIMLRTEVTSKLADRFENEIGPPPAWSFARDFKPRYDASIPEAAGGYLSYLTMTKTPSELLSELKATCQEAFQASVDHISTAYKTLYPDRIQGIPNYNCHVVTYQELFQDALDIDKEGAETCLRASQDKAQVLAASQGVSLPELNFLIIKDLLDFVAYNKPTVVISLSPPYYPHISSQSSDKKKNVIHKIMTYLNVQNIKISKKNFFMGISDLSYTGLQDSKDVATHVKANMPLWREDIYDIPFAEMQKFDFPSIILGPWGKDLHQKTERVYLPDLVSKTPLMIQQIIDGLL